MTRTPIVAGRFYPDAPERCRAEAGELLKSARNEQLGKRRLFGGLAPHAGWMCSGALAAQTIAALAEAPRRSAAPRSWVLFGAVHSPVSAAAAVYVEDTWPTPLGEMPVDRTLAEAIVAGCPGAAASSGAHAREHSIEVLLPILQLADPEARVVPVMVPPSNSAAEIGARIAGIAADTRPDGEVVFLGSTDLTHYGPNYGITPAGTGDAGLAWATRNDARLLEIIARMDSEAVVAETSARHNACGGGAIAATLAASLAAGAKEALLLAHTNSYEVLKRLYPGDKANAVGYCSVVFG